MLYQESERSKLTFASGFTLAAAAVNEATLLLLVLLGLPLRALSRASELLEKTLAGRHAKRSFPARRQLI